MGSFCKFPQFWYKNVVTWFNKAIHGLLIPGYTKSILNDCSFPSIIFTTSTKFHWSIFNSWGCLYLSLPTLSKQTNCISVQNDHSFVEPPLYSHATFQCTIHFNITDHNQSGLTNYLYLYLELDIFLWQSLSCNQSQIGRMFL